MQEKLIERKLRDEIKNLGGTALKFASPYHRGVPDRIVLMPGGKIYFVELKSTGKKPSLLQATTIEHLRALGFTVFIIDSQDKLNEFIDHVNL